MGKREVHICDVCKRDLPFDGMFPSFQAASIEIRLYANMWGNPENIAGWKGELCAECVAIINRTAEFFHRELNQREVKARPGEHVSSPEAEVSKPKKRKPKRRT